MTSNAYSISNIYDRIKSLEKKNCLPDMKIGFPS